MTTPSIFISYRIADTGTEARLLFTDLTNYFGPDTAFLDKKRLDPGMDWPEELETNVRNAKVLIVLIQDVSKWLSVNEFGARRTDDPNDWVRKEIETALSHGKEIIPVLLNGVLVPPAEFLPETIRKLPRKQAVKITTEKWDSDIAELLKALEKHIPRRQTDAPLLHPLAEYPLPKDELDPLPHYPAPFLGLRFFDRNAARLFFGRTRELLHFFGCIENPDIRLICLYGHSGVGKSSFLAAGVLPRIESFREVHYERRKKTDGLGKQVEKLRTLPKKPGKPTVYILDQVEEIFTDPLPGEPDFFVRTLAAVMQTEPESTVVLGFRSDYLLDLSDLLTRVDCSREDLPLRPLDQPALVEAIEGLWHNDKLRQRYSLNLEPGFAGHVSRDLMNSESGGAASILQNRLLKLYDEAKKRRTTADPLIHLRIEDYQQLKQNAVAEEELLDFQLQRLRDENLHDGADEKSILETLDRFVVDKPTAGTQLKENLSGENSRLREGLRRVNLLTEIPESQAIRLSHDLLAPIVRKRYSRLLLDTNERLEIENVRLRLDKVRDLLLGIEFMEAGKELLEVGKNNVVPEEVWPLAFELSFVLLQAGEKMEGEQSLLICAGQMRHAGLLIPAFPDDTFPHRHDFPELLHYLRRCDPALFIRLERRYFPVMRPIPGGAFDMGDVMGDKEYDDETVHRVEVDAFELAETPVTWQQYGLFCLATNQELPNDSGWGRADRPVIEVSWYDAVEYCNWLSERQNAHPVYAIDKEQKDPNNKNESESDPKWTVALHSDAKGFRLPTEAEWEYAAREGGKQVRFGNGKDMADPSEINFDGSESNKKDYSKVGQYRSKTTPVYQFTPNALGLHDMSGNVEEWCWDWYGDYPSSSQTNPAGPESGSSRVVRGGSWDDGAVLCRVACRFWGYPDDRGYDVGFRPARTVSP